MDKESDDIVSSFKKTVISDELSKISENASEIAIDAILHDGLLKDIPVIGTTIALYKVGKTLTARQQIKKLFKFLFYLNEVSQADRIKFLGNFEDDKKSKSELFERTLFILERLDDERKAEIIGRLFKNLILEKIKAIDYLRLSLIVDRTYLTDLTYFDMRYNMNCRISKEEKYKFSVDNDTKFITENLTTSGLLTKKTVENKAMQILTDTKEKTYVTKYEISGIGKVLIEFGY